MAKSSTVKKKRKVQVESRGKVYIKATFNNTFITLTNDKGEVVCWSTAGKKGFKGAKKSTPYAALQAAKDVSAMALGAGVKSVIVFVKGLGPGRESAIKGLYDGGLPVNTIIDETPFPHNGCRPAKKRRN